MSETAFRLEFDEDGTLRQRGRDGWREPICPECGQRIAWVLDMTSFKRDVDGSYVACHARCVWLPEAFIYEVGRIIRGT